MDNFKKNNKAEQDEWQAARYRLQHEDLRRIKEKKPKNDQPIHRIGKARMQNKMITVLCILLIIVMYAIAKDRNNNSPPSSKNITSTQGAVSPAKAGKQIPQLPDNADPSTSSEKSVDISPVEIYTRSAQKIETIIPSFNDSQQNQIMRTLKTIVFEYRKTHTYSKTDMFACTDMSIDVWNMVRTKGINAVIVVGNIQQDVSSIREANHAWVIAEASPGKFVALETTGGFLVCPDGSECHSNNDRYFYGWIFNSPKDLKEAQEKIKHPCPSGYVLGENLRCYLACGPDTYCKGSSVCVNGRCRGCLPGYYMGTDLNCHKS